MSNIKLFAYVDFRERMYGATHCDKLKSRQKTISTCIMLLEVLSNKQIIWHSNIYKARFRRRTFHAPNLISHSEVDEWTGDEC
jgi:hypothetical protein